MTKRKMGEGRKKDKRGDQTKRLRGVSGEAKKN